MSFLGFLLKKKFYIHLGISMVLSVFLLLLLIFLLKSYTRHGHAYMVPDLVGKMHNELGETEDTRMFNFVITDSVYDNSQVPGSIIKQNPSPGSKAKEGRTIYLTVVSYTPKMSIMPDLKDLTVRQAITTLRTDGIKVKAVHFVPHFAGNSVLGQYFNGDTLVAGTEILEGSEIDLIAGLGARSPARVPFVVGLTRDDARSALQMASFNVGWEHYMDDPNPMHSKVYRQFPLPDEQLYPGDSVTLYYRSDLGFDFDRLVKSMKNDSLALDSTYIMMIDSSELEEE